jgi:hypothetical protein
VLGAAFLLLGSCGIFEPREPEEPSESGLNFRPPTEPAIVITNLQAAIDQKNIANYMSCFPDPARGGRVFEFYASAEAGAVYPGALTAWTYDNEREYLQNLIARSPSNAFSNLLLAQTSSVITADSVVYTFAYTLTFEHSEAGFPQTAKGNLQFTLGVDNSNFWAIHRWSDFKSTDDVTWSLFKGRFAN